MTCSSSIKWCKGLVFVCLSLLLSLGPNQRAQANEEGFQVFSRVFYPMVRERCRDCHEANRSPFFASDDIQESYDIARTLIDFSDISSSVFVVRTMNNHCNRAVCQTDGREMLDALLEWKLGEFPENLPPPPPPEVETAGITLGSTIPEAPLFETLRWTINNVPDGQGGTVNGVVFEIEIQKFGDDSFLFRKPRLGTANTPLEVSGITVLINDHPSANQRRFTDVAARVTPNSNMATGLFEFPVLSPRSDIINRAMNSTNTVKIAFANLHATQEGMACQNLDLFQANVLPTFRVRNCTLCHSTRNFEAAAEKGISMSTVVEATRRFNMQGSVQSICNQSLARVNRARPEYSPLVVYPLGIAGQHPPVIPSVDEIFPDWMAWIQGESSLLVNSLGGRL